MARWTHILILFSCICAIFGDDKCRQGQKCIPVSQCSHTSEEIVFSCGPNKLCCSTPQQSASIVDYSSTSKFPINCGIVSTSDKISGGQKADLGQFPWMALLGYKQKNVDIVQFLCGGSIITEFYVLSAAHCINLERQLALTTIRLGELDLQTEIDCLILEKGGKDCADPYVEVSIDTTTIHPQFDDKKLKNDIALIKVKQRIKFTEFIRPICLPFGRNLQKRNFANENFIISGWGKTNARNVGGSTILQYTTVRVWHESNCNKNVPPQVKPINHLQLCANGPQNEDACKGDSGGPLVNATIDKDKELRYFQVGVVSFASSLTCGNPELPTVYTRLDRYLDWITENVN